MLPKKAFFGMFVDFFTITLVCSGVLILVSILYGQLLEVSGDSMLPTLSNGQQLFAEKISLQIKPITRGNIVVFKHPDNSKKLIIKRVVGLPNESFEFKQGKVLIGDLNSKEGLQELVEPYITEGVSTYGKSFLKEGIIYTIEKDKYLVLGDNRMESTDSREWGFLDKAYIVGRGFFRFYPIKDAEFIYNK